MAKTFDDIRVPTTDNWCSNFPNNTVSVSLRGPDKKRIKGQKREWLISVWGDDDWGISKRFSDYREARDLFDKLIKSKDLTQAYLKSLGFDYWA